MGARTTSLYDAVVACDLLKTRRAIRDGCRPNVAPDGVPLLFIAGLRGYTDIVAELIRAGVDVNARDTVGRSALQLLAISACTPKQLSIMKQLIEAGASVSACDRMGNYPLEEAIVYGNGPAAKILIEAGAFVGNDLKSRCEMVAGHRASTVTRGR